MVTTHCIGTCTYTHARSVFLGTRPLSLQQRIYTQTQRKAGQKVDLPTTSMNEEESGRAGETSANGLETDCHGGRVDQAAADAVREREKETDAGRLC